MIKIITALNNPKINEELNKQQDIKVLTKDIQYKEGIIEILEENKNIDLILINEKIDGDIELNILINKILKINSKIKIYLILKEENKIEQIKEKKNLIILKEKKINIKEIIEIIKYGENSKQTYKTNSNNKTTKINISGAGGVGKSIITLIISHFFENQKVLIVNSELENKNILNIIQKNNIKTRNNNIDLISNKNIKTVKLNKYNKIVFDINNNENNIDLKDMDFYIIIIEPNLLGINKAKNIIDKYIEKFKINKNKIKIIINKKNKYSINENIIKEIFLKIEIIAKINNNEIYEKIINNNFKKIKNTILNSKDKTYKNMIKKLDY